MIDIPFANYVVGIIAVVICTGDMHRLRSLRFWVDLDSFALVCDQAIVVGCLPNHVFRDTRSSPRRTRQQKKRKIHEALSGSKCAQTLLDGFFKSGW